MRCASYCNLLDQFIFRTGGVSSRTILRTVERYDILRNVWEEMPQMKVGRYNHGSCTLGSAVYALCGQITDIECLNSVEKLDTRDLPAGWRLIKMPPTSFVPRASLVTAALDSHQILIMGGWDSLDFLSDVWSLDTRDQSFRLVIREAPFGFFVSETTPVQVSPGVVVSTVSIPFIGYRLVQFKDNIIQVLY